LVKCKWISEAGSGLRDLALRPDPWPALRKKDLSLGWSNLGDAFAVHLADLREPGFGKIFQGFWIRLFLAEFC
jgi:hypothetical protein